MNKLALVLIIGSAASQAISADFQLSYAGQDVPFEPPFADPGHLELTEYSAGPLIRDFNYNHSFSVSLLNSTPNPGDFSYQADWIYSGLDGTIQAINVQCISLDISDFCSNNPLGNLMMEGGVQAVTVVDENDNDILDGIVPNGVFEFQWEHLTPSGAFGWKFTMTDQCLDCEGEPPYVLFADRPPVEIELLNSLNSEQCVEAVNSEGAVVDVQVNVAPQGYLLEWSETAGATGIGESFSVNVGVGQTTDITLTLTDEDNVASSITESVCVSDTIAPQIDIISPVSGDTVNSFNMRLQVNISDTVDEGIDTYDVVVGKRIVGTLDGDGNSSLNLSRRVPSGYSETEITVTAEDASGNKAEETVIVFEKKPWKGLSNWRNKWK